MADGSELLTKYGIASANDDLAGMEALRHPDWEMVWPQTGEVVTGNEAYAEIRMHRPEGIPPRVRPLRLGGSGDCWWSEAGVEYGDGSRWLAVNFVELEDDLVRRERVYFMQPLPAPDWRAHLVRSETPAISVT